MTDSKIIIYFILLFVRSTLSNAQDKLLSPKAMIEDLHIIRNEIFHVHANPFTQLNEEKYKTYLDSLEVGLNKPLSVPAFQRKAMAALLPLGDEHAAVSLRNTSSRQNAPSWADSVVTNISYKRVNHVGYIFARSFATRGNQDLSTYKRCIDSIFAIIHQDGITHLVIDVSNNDGGASAVGNMIINHIYRRPYQTYSMNWRRSEAYQARLTSWGLSDEHYQKALPGEILHFPSKVMVPEKVSNPFQGKVVVIIGPETFSSAIMFATLVQDNNMALLAGEAPINGHPTHFGEMYLTLLPNSQLELRFGVKEWIRPAGRNRINKLVPDIPYTLPRNKDFRALIKSLQW